MEKQSRLAPEHVVTCVNKLHEKYGSWRKVAKATGISHGTLNAIVLGKPGAASIETQNKILGFCGFPCQAVMTWPCSCGDVHTHDCLTHTTRPKHKPVRAKPRRRLDITNYDITHEEAYDLLSKYKRG